MRRTWLQIAALLWALESCGVVGYVVGPLDRFKIRSSEAAGTKPIKRRVDDSVIHFPSDNVQHPRMQRSEGDHVLFSDLYPQMSLNAAQRDVRQDDSPAHGPQNGWGNNGFNSWGDQGFNGGGNQGFNNARRPNRPNSFPSFQPNNGGGNRQWGNPDGTFNRPDVDYEEQPFIFGGPTNGFGGSRPQPGGNGGSRPQPGGNGGSRPQPGGSGSVRPQPGGGGGRPRPGNGAGGRPRPPTQPPPTTVTTSDPMTGAPVTSPTPAPTRPGCNCPSTPEFNPVCGQDRVTYSNPGKLKCANVCGNNVRMLHYGSCVTTTTAAPSG